MKLLPLCGKHAVGNSAFALVDDDVFDVVNKLKWHVVACGKNKSIHYVATRIGPYRLYLHRAILGIPSQWSDHIDGNTLNNQRSNLREATPSQNCQNRRSLDNTTSKFVGVSYCKRSRKWRARVQGKLIGYFLDEESAARARDKQASITFGEFARLNFPAIQGV